MEDLAGLLRQIFQDSPALCTVTARNLRAPTPELAMAVYEGFINEFYLGKVLVPNAFAKYLAVAKHGGDSFDPAVIRQRALVSAVRWLLSSIPLSVGPSSSCPQSPTFSLLDLLDPDPARFEVFVKSLGNFWMYANQMMPEVEKVREEDRELKFKMDQSAHLRKRAEQAAADNAEIARRQEAAVRRTAEAKEKMNSLLERCQGLNLEHKRQLGLLAEGEAEERNLQKAANELGDMEQRLRSLEASKAEAEELKAKDRELESALEDLAQIQQEKEAKVRSLRSELSENNRHLAELKGTVRTREVACQEAARVEADVERLREAIAKVDAESASAQADIEAVSEDLRLRTLAWMKKEACLKAELQEFIEAKAKMEANMSAEEANRLEMVSEIKALEQETAAIMAAMKEEAAGVRRDFAAQKAKFEAFEKEIAEVKADLYS